MPPAHHKVPHRTQVLGSGIFNLILTLGVARFAYTPLLPLMQAQAGLGVAEAAWLASVYYLGYLTGAVAASFIEDLVVKDRLYRLGLIAAVVTTAMMGLSTHPAVWLLSRFFAGLSGAAGLLLGSGLILNWLIRQDHRSDLGLHFSGIGLGIAGSAAAVALMTRAQLDWRAQWAVFTGIGALCLVPAWSFLPPPDRSTLSRLGNPLRDAPPSRLFLGVFMAAYFCAGIGFVVSMTFIVAIIDHLPGLTGEGSLVFLIIGLVAAPSAVLWDWVAHRIGELNALILAAVLQIVGILLPVLATDLVGAFAGAILFGTTVVGLVSLVLTMAGRYYPTKPAKMMGKMTLTYGIAQVIGPTVTGALAAHFGDYRAGLYLAALVMSLGTVLLTWLRAMEAQPDVLTDLDPT